MLTGQSCSRAIRGHLLASLTLMLMLLEEFWKNLCSEERSHLKMLYDSDPSSKEDDDLADRLCSWYE